MKKRIWIIALALVSALCFFGCANPGNNNGNNDGDAPVDDGVHKHAYAGYVCDGCLDLDPLAPITESLEYTDNDDGACTVTAYVSDGAKYVKIPQTHDGKTVTGIGDRVFEYSEISVAEIPEGVTELGDAVFGDCKRLKCVQLPQSLTDMGSYTFRGCASLTEIVLPSGITEIPYGMFEDCKMLERVELPDDVNTIGYGAFGGCSRLKNVNIPDSVTVIKKETFKDCAALTEIVLPGALAVVEESAFYGCKSMKVTDIPSGVVKIGKSAFEGCESISSVVIPTGIASIEEAVFRGCSGLESVTIHGGVVDIGLYAFMNCGLKSLSIPKSVAFIWADAFRGCNKLESIDCDKENTKYGSSGNCLYDKNYKEIILGCKNSVIPTDPSIYMIGYYAFSNIPEITSVTIPSNILYLWGSSFYGCDNITSLTVEKGHPKFVSEGNCIINRQTETLVAGCKNSVVPTDGITTVAERAFEGSGITELALPQGVKFIGQCAYYDCKNLTRIVIPDTVENIGNRAFGSCSGLTEVTVNARFIETGAFEDCTSLKTAALSDGVLTIGDGAFEGCFALDGLTLGNGINKIGNGAFGYCFGLTVVNIPESVTNMGARVFGDCANLVINCAAASKPDGWSNSWCEQSGEYSAGQRVVWGYKNNSADADGYEYVKTDNIVYGVKDGEATVIKCSAGATGVVTVPATVRYNGVECAVTAIAKQAFYDCGGITAVELPASIAHVEQYAVWNCKALTTVKYAGTVAQWNEIADEDYNAFSPSIQRVECKDGIIEY